MYHLPLSHPAYQPYLERSLQDRTEAQSRAAYLAIVGVESVAAFIGRTAVAGLRRAAGGYRRARSRRRTIQALSKLDDRLLRDIGIYPGDIEQLATEMTESPSRPYVQKAETFPDLAPPRLRLDLGCPEMKHAA
jgi:uncharacterized protein YjiS (DUF1127 family)